LLIVDARQGGPCAIQIPFVCMVAGQAAEPKKRRGPLPVWLSELLVLGAFGGFAYASAKYSAEMGKVGGFCARARGVLREPSQPTNTSICLSICVQALDVAAAKARELYTAGEAHMKAK
jgi:hypothetical protein